MRLPRLTTRRLMALIAVLALALGVGLESWRLLDLSDLYRQKASHHARMARQYQQALRNRDASRKDLRRRAKAYRACRIPNDAADFVKKNVEALSGVRLDNLSPEAIAPPGEPVRTYLIERAEFNESLASEDDKAILYFSKAYPYHTSLARIYDRAARYPWLHVPPEPPEPK
jgi:hypothetical protein